MSDPRDNPLGYAQPDTEIPRPRRSLARWLVLLLVWAIGLAIWAVYLALIAVLILRLFGTAPA